MTTLDKFLSGSPRTEQDTDLTKIASDKVAVEKVASDNKPSFIKVALDKYAAEIRTLNNKVLELEKRAEIQDRATKIACQLLNEGRIGAREVIEKIAELKTKNLEVVEEAIKLGYDSSSQNNSLGSVAKGEVTYNDNPILKCLLNS